MNLTSFKEKLSSQANIDFAELIALIDELYMFTPTEFTNGEVTNLENQNNGSCKLFAFAQLQNLSEEETLACFGSYYTEDVLEHLDGDDHQNIRNFMKSGWDGIDFKGVPLIRKQ